MRRAIGQRTTVCLIFFLSEFLCAFEITFVPFATHMLTQHPSLFLFPDPVMSLFNKKTDIHLFSSTRTCF